MLSDQQPFISNFVTAGPKCVSIKVIYVPILYQLFTTKTLEMCLVLNYGRGKFDGRTQRPFVAS